jgi:ABC-type multidrug transport system permease subunit
VKSQTDLPATSDRQRQERKKWVEPVAALLMALATLSTAWCSYQSAAWTRKSNRLMNEFNALERKAGLMTMQGTQQATIHAAMFMQLLAAQQAGNEKLVNFYVERFPSDVRKAYDAWSAQRPFENPNADPHPFVPKLYEPRGTREAADANAKAATNQREAGAAGSISGQYLANTVLFAAVLFFASASGKFEQRRVRLMAFIFATAVFIFALVRTAMLPI